MNGGFLSPIYLTNGSVVTANRILIFVPTYNESENVRPLFERLSKLNLGADILFLDDSSPDGTGKIMDEIAGLNPHVHVIHRSGKLGIGSAHKTGIRWAYEKGYQTLITMDADFTHSPEDIPALLSKSGEASIVVGSRYLMKNSLEGWNLIRKGLTQTAHVLTRVLLGIKQDSTGAFRVYRLDQISKEFPDAVKSNGYSFFFESLYLLSRNHFKIAEVPIALPPRTYGSSKMSYLEILKSIRQLVVLYLESFGKKRTLIAERS